MRHFAEATRFSVVYLCHCFHRKLEETAGFCVTHRGGYSCIGFYSCFLVSGLLSGDTVVCTLVAEVPDR